MYRITEKATSHLSWEWFYITSKSIVGHIRILNLSGSPVLVVENPIVEEWVIGNGDALLDGGKVAQRKIAQLFAIFRHIESPKNDWGSLCIPTLSL
jgi:hypothetical protein